MNSFNIEALVTVAVRGRFYEHHSLEAVKTLKDEGLIEVRPGDIPGDMYKCKLTEKGRIMMNAIMSIPMPVQAWTMPGKE